MDAIQWQDAATLWHDESFLGRRADHMTWSDGVISRTKHFFGRWPESSIQHEASNKWNDSQLQTLCAVKGIKYKLLFHKLSQYLPRGCLRECYSELNLCLCSLKLSMPAPQTKINRPFWNSDISPVETSKRLEKVLHSSRSFGSLVPRCWNGVRLRSCRHLADPKKRWRWRSQRFFTDGLWVWWNSCDVLA